MGVYLNVREKISGRIRKAYYEVVLRQNIGWFDGLNPNELASKMLIETYTIQQGLGDKISQFFMALSTIIAGFVMEFSRGCELTLVLCGVLPFLLLEEVFMDRCYLTLKKKLMRLMLLQQVYVNNA